MLSMCPWRSCGHRVSLVGVLAPSPCRFCVVPGIPVPSILVNGRLLLKSSYDGPQSIFGAIGQEQQNFQQAVYTGALRDEAAVDDFIASMGVLSAYHPDITPSLAQEGGEDGMPGEHDVQVMNLSFKH